MSNIPAGFRRTISLPGRSRGRTPTEKTTIQLQIGATGRQIDKLVYAFYGLSEEEISIVGRKPDQ